MNPHTIRTSCFKFSKTLLAAGLLATAAGAVQAQTSFSDRTAWEAAAGAVLVEDFESVALGNITPNTEVTLGELTLFYDRPAGASGSFVRVIDAAHPQNTNGTNQLFMVLDGTPSDSVTIRFWPPVTAWGADFDSANGNEDVDISIPGLTERLARNTSGFIGFTSPTPFTELTIDDPFVSFVRIRFDNVAFSSPFGDECPDAVDVSLGGTFTGDYFDNTGSTGDDSSCASFDDVDRWYTYTAAESGVLTIDTCRPGMGFTPVLAVYDDCPESGGAEILCTNSGPGCAFGPVGNAPTVSLPVAAGETYYVRLSADFGTPEPFSGIEIDFDFAPLVVDNLDDGPVNAIGDLPGSLRQVIFNAEQIPGADTITFEPMLAGGTITLTEGQIRIRESIEIIGLGADQLTISGGGASRLFQTGGSGINEYVYIGLTLADGDTTNATDDRRGGAIRQVSSDVLRFESCVLRGNGTPGRSGGAVYMAFGDLSVQDSAVINTVDGDGIIHIQDATADIRNTTFSGNGGIFGCIWARGTDTEGVDLTVAHCTFVNNPNTGRAGSGSAIVYSAEGADAVTNVRYEHTIFADNARGAFGVGGTAGTITVDSLGYNILDDDSGDDTPDPTDLLNSDPQVGPLEARDGTFAHFPLFGSPALNAGDPAAVAGQSGVPEFDQRGAGFDRVLEGRIDIGAIESTPEPVACSPADVTTDATSNGVPDGVVTLSDFSFYLSLWSQDDAAADITADGVCDLGTAGDGVTLSDFSCYLSLWSQGCS